ncbi:MAG: helix-turn-helix domain-containing protein [Burkholderiaceae bacterium]
MRVHQTKPVSEKVPNDMAESGAWEGARRATGHAPESAAAPQAGGLGSEVIAEVTKRSRRRFTNTEKRRILAAADRCTQPGELGALLRKEGVYSSSLSTWRRQREQAELDALAPAKRGPKVPANRAEVQQIARLTQEVGRLQSELDKALLVIGVQKNWRLCSVARSTTRPRARDGRRRRTRPGAGRARGLPGLGGAP